MNHFIIVKGGSLVAETKVSKRTRQFVGVKWTSDPRNAQTYDIGNATEIAKQYGGTVLPYSKITQFYR
jgi:hypothetical protein